MQPLQLLIVEDSADDAALLLRELRNEGFEPKWTLVETEPDFLRALQTRPDIILADYSMPRFSGLRALDLLQASGLDIPLILISGAVGEAVAVEAMRKGVADYLLKDRIARLAGAVRRALSETQMRAERNHAQAELMAAGQRFQLVFESAPNGILLVNSVGVIALINAHAENMFGCRRDDLIGQAAEKLVPSLQAGFFQGCATGTLKELSGIRKDGSEFPVEIALNSISINGEMSVLCSIMDITERKRADSIVLEASRLKSEFLANLSHEIRTPMNVLVGMSALLLETDLTSDQQDQAETIRGGAEALLAVINDSLDFSKIEAGKLEIDPVDFQIDSVVEDVTAFFSQLSRRRGLESTCFIDSDVPQFLHGDGGRLRQVLSNLVGNAIKFTERGEVNLRVLVAGQSEPNTVLRFEVQDTGIGIAPETQGRLFQAFTQADGSTTRRYGGTGLGLAICKRLVEMMSGTIGLISEFGKGSTFWFEIPFEPAREIQAADAPTANLAGVKVLVVDDNEANRIILKRQLESWEMKPMLAQNALEAITMVRAAAASGNPVGLIVLDYGMPGMNGVDIARIIRSDSKVASTPMMMLTSYNERSQAEAAKEIGIHVYLTKPARRHQLRRAIAALLKQPGERVEIPRQTKAPASRTGPKLLLVEDNSDNQKLMVRLLQKYGYDCDVVGNGHQALAMISSSEYPLILMDCQMPEMDGFQATVAIREREGKFKRTPIIAMTAHALQGARERCLQAGMDDYLSKPVNEGLLVRTIEHWSLATTPGAAPAFQPLPGAKYAP